MVVRPVEREAARSVPAAGTAGDRGDQARAVGLGAATAGSEPTFGSASHELLASVADHLRKLGEDSNAVAAELRRRVELLGAPGTPRGSANKVSHAVLRELLQTLAERADGIGRETQLIAGVLERAREQLEKARAPRFQTPPRAPQPERREPVPAPERPQFAQRPGAVPAAVRRRPGPTPRELGEARADAGGVPEGVRLIAIQMALDGTDAAAIAHRLREEFGVPEPGRAVEAVFGSQARNSSPGGQTSPS